MTDKEKRPFVHISSAKQLVPQQGPDQCEACKVELEAGYGLAGGGIGVYMYCPKCGLITNKVQDHS